MITRSPNPPTIRERIAAQRSRLFVGRKNEKKQFRSLLDTESPAQVLFVTAPGGTGKTTLLHEYEGIAADCDNPCFYFDARNLPVSPDGANQLIQQAIDSLSDARSQPYVLIFDTFELLAALEGWFYQSLIPGLPASARVVIACRNPPAVEWRTDPGWVDLLQVQSLPYFSSALSREYLSRRGIDQAIHDECTAFSRGSPLALALIAEFASESAADVAGAAGNVDEVLQLIVERLNRDLLDNQQIRALQGAALPRFLTEPMLKRMLGTPDAGELYDWLRKLSFMETGPRGIFPHDLVRDALAADFRIRNPSVFETYIRRAHKELDQMISHHDALGREDLVVDKFFLDRDLPTIQKLFLFEHRDSCYCDWPTRDDWPQIRAMTAKHEGEGRAEFLDFLYDTQPEGLIAVRNQRQELRGYLFAVAMEKLSEAQARDDVLCHEFWQYMQAVSPLKENQRATLFRFWMDRDCFQDTSAVQTQVCAYVTFYPMVTANLALQGFVHPYDDVWRNLANEAANFHQLGELYQTPGGHECALTAHDYRDEPPVQWLANAPIRLRSGPGSRGLAATTPARQSFTQPEFEDAVKRALKAYARPDRLRDNPLLYSSLVQNQVSPEADASLRAEALRRTLRETSEQLAETDKTAKFHQIIDRSYFRPMVNQSAAAEALHLTRTTYYRRLSDAMRLLAARLWEQEQALHD